MRRGGWLLAPLLGVASGFTGFGLIVSTIGAAIALLVAYFVQQRVADRPSGKPAPRRVRRSS